MHHHIHFNIDKSYRVKILIGDKSYHFSNIHNSYIGIMALQNHSYAYIKHIKYKYGFSLTNFVGIEFVSSFRELVNHHLIHLTIYGHNYYLKHTIML